MLPDSNPHLLCAKESLLSIRLTRNCEGFFSILKVLVQQYKAHILRRLLKIGRKVIEYAYVSGQCRQTILVWNYFEVDKFYLTDGILLKLKFLAMQHHLRKCSGKKYEQHLCENL